MSAAVSTPPIAELPSAAQLLLRARLRARRDAVERSLRPVAVWGALVRVVTLALAAAVVLGGSTGLLASGVTGATVERALLAIGAAVLCTVPAWIARQRGSAA